MSRIQSSRTGIACDHCTHELQDFQRADNCEWCDELDYVGDCCGKLCECGNWVCNNCAKTWTGAAGSERMCPQCFEMAENGPSDAQLAAYYNQGGGGSSIREQAEAQARIQRELK